MTPKRKERGQIALGLAFAYTAVLVIFVLVLQSSLITREKMKLQQTTDLAALVAADVQRRNLNEIHRLNKAIEDAYKLTQAALAPPVSWCWVKFASLFSSAKALHVATSPFHGTKAIDETDSLADLEGKIASEKEDEIKKKLEDEAEGIAGELCQEACQGVDSFSRNQIIKGYDMARTIFAGEILNILEQANQYAANKALDTYLTPKNLPVTLQRLLEERLGVHITRGQLRNEYEKGTLKEFLHIVETNREAWLFAPSTEVRALMYNQYRYLPQWMGYNYGCHPPIPVGPRPAFTTAKVTKDGDYLTSFLTGLQYFPPQDDEDEVANDLVKKFSLYLLSPHRKKKTWVTDRRGKKIPLFTPRQPTTVLSAAKPYGGTFPESSALYALGGDPGRVFEGAKLIGIADQKEFGVPLPRPIGAILDLDDVGNVRNESHYYAEDFLH